MRCLFDTQLLVWAVHNPKRLPQRVSAMIDDPKIARHFSVISVWEVVVKAALRKPGFDFDAQVMRSALLKGDLHEIEISSAHALAVRSFSLLHRDPFDRMLVAQAFIEGLTLVTADRTLARYPIEVLLA